MRRRTLGGSANVRWLLAIAVTVLVLGVAAMKWPFGPEVNEAASATEPMQEPTAGATVLATPTASTKATKPEFRDAQDCPVYTPPKLPSGTAPGAPRPYPADSPEPYSSAFGQGRDLVVVNRGREAAEQTVGNIDDFPGDWPGPNVSGEKRAVVWVGDPPWGTVQVRFVVDSCAYVVFLNPEGRQSDEGFTQEDVVDYARSLT